MSTIFDYLRAMKRSFTREIRAFNRFYTNIIGLLDRHILNSEYSLPEVRILYELYHHSGLTASELIALLGIDKGYLSRILRRFEKAKLISKAVGATDKRSASIKLTFKGKKEFEELDSASNKQIDEVFGSLDDSECMKLIQRFTEIQQILNR